MTNASANNHRTEPFICIPQALVLRKDVSPLAIKVLLILYSFCNRTTGQCNPRRATLAKRAGISMRSLDRATAQLRGLNILRTSRRNGRGCAYEFATQEEWQTTSPPLAKAAPVGRSELPHLANQSCQQWQIDGQLSLYEPDTFEPDILTRAADTPGRVLGTAAAAAASDDANQLEHPEPVEATPQTTPASTQVEELTTQVDPQARPVSHPEMSANVRSMSGSVSEAEALAWELLAEHPQPGLPLKAIAEIEKVLRRDPAAAEVIRAHHPAWCEYWLSLPAEKFVPMLWRWIAEGEWRIEPVVRKPMGFAGRMIDGREIDWVEPLRR